MLTTDIISSFLNTNTVIHDTISSGMAGLVTPLELSTLLGLLVDPITSTEVAILTPKISSIESILTDKATTSGKAQASAESNEAAIAKAPCSSRVQDNIGSFKIGEAPVVSKKYTSVVDLPMASNALSEDYPNTHGVTDEAQNWYKVNKTTKYIEFVHSSGSYLKIDGAGNASFHLTGSLKWIVDKDMLVNIIGSLDLHSINNMSIEAPNIDLGF